MPKIQRLSPRLANQIAAGEVVEAVSARGIAHRVEGDSILVDSAQRDALRLALASEGLPANGPQG